MDDPIESKSGPDLGLVQPPALGLRMADNGPRYKETPADPYAPDAPPIAEPFNTVTAALFIGVAVAWMARVRGRFARFPFLTSCLPILLVGGVGGTLYHAFRTRKTYFYLDVIPISVLGVAGAAFLAIKLWKRAGYLYLVGGLLGYVGLSAVMFTVLVPLFPAYRTLGVNATYAALAVVIVIPMAGVLIRTRFRHGGFVTAALASFGIAWFCRLIDDPMKVYPPMGTHWLWHTFGAVTTWMMIEYFYRVEGEAV